MNRILKQRVRTAVIVTLKTGAAFRGVLYDHDKQAVSLRNAEALTAGNPTAVDGEIVVFVADVAHLQFI